MTAMIKTNYISKVGLTFLLSLLILNGFAGSTLYNVRDYGATGEKKDKATVAIQKAIDAANKSGGGVVVIPRGEYLSLPIKLYSNITLQLDAGAVLYADLANPDFKGQSLINAERAHNITIKGKGMVDGQASHVYEDVRGEEPAIKEEMDLARAAGVEMKRYYRSGKGAFNLFVKECDDLTIEDVTFANSSLWCMRIWGSNRINIRGVNVFSSLEKGVNSDGIDIDGSRNVHISGCTISAGDDAIVIKTGTMKWDGQMKTNTAENIIVDNCVLSSSSAGLKLGTESYGDMHHIVFSNCVIRNSNKGIEINVQDGANVSDIIFSNLTMDLKRRHWNWWGDAQVFNFLLKKRNDSSKVGSIKNILVNNVIAHAQGTSRIISNVEQPIQNFTISNLKLFMEAESTPDKRTSNAMYFLNVQQLKLKNIEIYWGEDKKEPKWKSALVMENVKGFELQGIEARQAFDRTDEPAISLYNCMNGTVFNCIAQTGTGTFIKVTGAQTANLVFGKNFTTNAITPMEISAEVKKQMVSF